MGITVYDENGEVREGEDGRFDRDYYKADENGNLVPNSFSDRDVLIMSTYVAYDYDRNHVKTTIADNQGKEIEIDINSSLFSSGEYKIVGGVNGGRNKVDGVLEDHQDTEGILTEDYTNHGYDALIVVNVATGEKMLINIGSESGEGTENPAFEGEDWDCNAMTAQNRENPQFIDASYYFEHLMKKGHNIVVVVGNSLGGGDTNYTGYIWGDTYKDVRFISYNPSGIPSSMLIPDKVFPPNVYSIIGSADILYTMQTGGGSVDTHMVYPKYSIFQTGIFGVGSLDVDHRGIAKPMQEYKPPAIFELLPFDLLTGDVISENGYSHANVKITPEVLEIIANNYSVEIDETNLINDTELAGAIELVSDNMISFGVNLESNMEDFTTAIDMQIGTVSDKMTLIEESLPSIIKNSPFIAYDLVDSFGNYKIGVVNDVVESVRKSIKSQLDSLEEVIKNPLELTVNIKVSPVLSMIESDLNDLKTEFSNFFPDNNNIVSEINRVAGNFKNADNSDNKLLDMVISDQLVDGSLVSAKDYRCLNTVKAAVDTAIDIFLEPLGFSIKRIDEEIINHWVVEVVKFFTDSSAELKSEKKWLESYTIYSEKTGLKYKTNWDLRSDEEAYENSLKGYNEYDVSADFYNGYASFLGKSAVEIENAITAIDEKLAEVVNLEDIIITLQNTDLAGLIVGAIDYYRPLLQNVALDILLCSGVMQRLNTVAINNYSFNQVAKNLNDYLTSDEAKSKAISKISDKHKEYMDNFKLWHKEICDITVDDIELENI